MIHLTEVLFFFYYIIHNLIHKIIYSTMEFLYVFNNKKKSTQNKSSEKKEVIYQLINRIEMCLSQNQLKI